jgi:hypothetical protein
MNNPEMISMLNPKIAMMCEVTVSVKASSTDCGMPDSTPSRIPAKKEGT